MTAAAEDRPADIDRAPITEEELAAWGRLAPEVKEMFGGFPGILFRWAYAREGDNFEAWCAIGAGLAIRIR